MRTTLHLFTLVLALLYAGNTYAQQKQLTFNYDEAGNQINRNIICVNCNPTVAEVRQENFLPPPKDSLVNVRQFNAYPNPLTEILNLKWNTGDKSYLKIIDVFSANGTRIYHKEYSIEQAETTISFLNLNSGMYVLRVIYSDGKQENLKVMKQ